MSYDLGVKFNVRQVGKLPRAVVFVQCFIKNIDAFLKYYCFFNQSHISHIISAIKGKNI